MMSENSSMDLLAENISVTTGTVDIQNSTNLNCPVGNSTVEMVVKALAYVAILVVSLAGNSFLILVIKQNKQLRKSINYFVLNMAVSDLFTPLTIIPVTIVQIISGSKSWKIDSPSILGNILCKLSYFLPDVSLVVSIISLLLISMDRFVAVVFPFKAKLISSKVRFISILCTWIIAIAVHAPYFYTFRLVPYENKTYCSSDWGPAFDHVETHKGFVTATFIIFILVPICLLVIVYATIAWTLKTNNKKTKEQLSCRQRRRDQQHKKIIRMSVAIIIAFVFCMIPLLVFMFTRVFLWNWQEPPICAFRTVVPFIATFMLHSWSAVNPCICLIFNKNYRDGRKQIASFISSRKTSVEEGSRRMQAKRTSIRKRFLKSSQV